MDFHKLKLEKFKTYNGLNIPNDIVIPLQESETPDVYFMFVSSIQEVMQSINIIQNKQRNKDNRIFFVFKKGNKTFGRDHINNVIMKHRNIKRKAPMLASLNKEYSVFCFMLDIR